VIDTPKTVTKLIGYPKVFLFPGHSPENHGSEGNGYIENTLAIELCELIVTEFEKYNVPNHYEVIHGRTRSEYLNKRLALLINYYKVDRNILAAEIHFDSSENKKAHGGHIIHHPDDMKAKELATAIQTRLVTIFPGRWAQLSGRKDIKFVRQTPWPDILIEVCFISNTADMEKYQAEKNHVAKEITAGILDYIKARQREA